MNNHNRVGKFYINLNIVMYIFVIIMIAINIQESLDKVALSGEELMFTFLLGAMLLALIATAIGLFRLKKKARTLAITWNLSIAFLFIGLKVIIGLILDQEEYVYSYYSFMQIIIGIVLVKISLSYMKEPIKNIFI